jgi:hypothetical protein
MDKNNKRNIISLTIIVIVCLSVVGILFVSNFTNFFGNITTKLYTYEERRISFREQTNKSISYFDIKITTTGTLYDKLDQAECVIKSLDPWNYYYYTKIFAYSPEMEYRISFWYENPNFLEEINFGYSSLNETLNPFIYYIYLYHNYNSNVVLENSTLLSILEVTCTYTQSVSTVFL